LVLGNQFLKAGRFDEAISELDLAREVNPNDERLYQSFGLILMRQGKFPIAVAVFAEAARLNPTNPTNALMKANALIHQAYSMNSQMVADRAQLLNKAEAAMVQASSLSDKKAKLDHLTLAMLYEMKTEPLKAAGELEEYLRENPNAQNAQDLRTIIAKLRSPASLPSPSKSPQ
jgi:tetratricopeptide (TPR) repeat protein